MKKYTFINAMVLSAALSGNVLADLNDGLVAYYPFNGNANDESGNGNDGTEHGGISYENGQIGQAANFDGIDDYIEIIPKSYVSKIGDFSIVAWVFLNNWKSQQPDRQYIFDGHSHSSSTSNDFYRPGFGLIYDLRNSNEEIYNFILYDQNTWTEQKISISSIRGMWHQLLYMRNGKDDFTYFDGKLLSATYHKKVVKDKPLNMAHNWFIGTFSGNNPNYSSSLNYSFSGLIDEMRIYNRALSESEIQQLYATTLETNISPKDSGTITKYPEKTSYSANEEVTLTATPAKGYKFKEWQGDASGSEATITIKMNGNQNVTAVFEEEEEEEKPPIEISSKAVYDSKTNTLSLEGILVPYIDEFTGKQTDNKGIFDVQLQEKTKLVFELIPWSINFKGMFEEKNTSGYILYDYKTRTVEIPCFEVMTIAKLGDGIEGETVYYKDVSMKQRHLDYPIFHVEDMTTADSCNL